MSSSRPSSTAAIHGSVKSFKHHDPDDFTKSQSDHCQQSKKTADTTSSFGVYPTQHRPDSYIEQNQHSASRIAAFVDDRIDSQVLHRHSSAIASIQEHTERLKVYLERFETTMTRS